MASEDEALSALDASLQQRPKKDNCDFSQATVCLVALRNRLTERLRAGEPVGPMLTCVNGIISTVVGAHFPLGEIQWPAVERARDALAELQIPSRT